jgi:hypothetical protein
VIRLAEPIGELVKGVRAFFVDHDVTAVVTAGFRERHRQTQGPGRANRVVFIPGDPTSGRAGKLGPVKNAGPRDVFSNEDPTVRVGTVRSIADWDRTLTLSVWGYDGDAPGDELAQLAAVTDLFEWTMRALSYVRQADILVGDVTFTLPGERAPAFGQELLVGLTLSHPLYDVPRDVVIPSFTLDKDPTPP